LSHPQRIAWRCFGLVPPVPIEQTAADGGQALEARKESNAMTVIAFDPAEQDAAPGNRPSRLRRVTRAVP
jgi:hypothetical protein